MGEGGFGRAALRAGLAALAGMILAASAAIGEVNSAALLAPKPPKLLSEFGFFDAAGAPAPGVVPYTLATPLFTDYADKDRFIFTPSPVDPKAEGVLDFPVGAALIKTFRYGTRKVETRVLLHQAQGWVAFPYLWDEAGQEAVLKIAGADLEIDTGQGIAAYHVPNVNQCKGCHIGPDKAFAPIGPKLRNLNHEGQLDALVAAAVLTMAPPDAPALADWTDAGLDLDTRARAYLDVNCGHCHQPGGPADTSGLFLTRDNADPHALGVMKRPVAAGRASADLAFDIVPGQPQASILLHRMDSTDPGVMMPELGRSMVHLEGIELIRDWIAAMEE